MGLRDASVPARSLAEYPLLVGPAAVDRALDDARLLRERLEGRTLWAVTARTFGVGIAESLRSAFGLARGVGIDARWVVVTGPDAWFRIVRRLDRGLAGLGGDPPVPGPAERAMFQEVSRDLAAELLARVRPDDLVFLHGPQTAGLVPHLAHAGVTTYWAAAAGPGAGNAETEGAWRFLVPFVAAATLVAFPEGTAVPGPLRRLAVPLGPPAVDPFCVRNRPLSVASRRTLLVHAGLLDAPDHGTPLFFRSDGRAVTLGHVPDTQRLGPPPRHDVPLVVHLARWDETKDAAGVMAAFAALVEGGGAGNAQLVIAGPNVRAVAGEADAAVVQEDLVGRYRRLPHEIRRRVHLAMLPVHDLDENAILVNALQRQAAVVVQKSRSEEFGFALAEAMWKGRAVLATGGGIPRRLITPGVDGVLVRDAADEPAFVRELARLLASPDLAERLGEAAHATIRDRFLAIHHIGAWTRLVARLEGGAAGHGHEAPAPP